MLLFTYIACLPPGTVAGALFRIEPKLVRAQTYPDGTFLVQEIIRRILDIPLCTYPLLGNKTPHIEEQSFIYIKRIPLDKKISFHCKQFPTRNICIYFFWLGNLLFSGCPEQRLATTQVSGLPQRSGEGRFEKKKRGREREGVVSVSVPSLSSPFRFAPPLVPQKHLLLRPLADRVARGNLL